MLKDERGIGMIELLLGLVVSGMMVSALAMPIFRIVTSTDRNNSLIAVLLEIDNAIRYIAPDGKMADYDSLQTGDPPVSSMTLTWTDYFGNQNTGHSASYYLSGTQLMRTYDGVTNAIADDITSAQFSKNGSVITVTLTAR